MRRLSALLALAYLAGNAVFAFLMIFLATFPFENQSPEDVGNDDWLIGVAVLLFALGLVTALAILLRRVALAVAAYVGAAGLGVALLIWAVDVSEHSDGKLLLWGTLVELAGLAAVTVTRGREPGS